MSAATEDDLRQYLSQRRSELEDAARKSREQNLAEMAHRGLLGSGAAIKAGAKAIEQTVAVYVADIATITERWSGPALAVSRSREIVVEHLRSVVEDVVTEQNAYRIGTRGDSATTLLSNLVQKAKQKLRSRIREIELGADRSDNEIARAIDKLIAELREISGELAAKIEPDAITIKSQLAKVEPNPTILREAGKSIRTTLEGAVGGMIGNALSPAAARALESLLNLLG